MMDKNKNEKKKKTKNDAPQIIIVIAIAHCLLLTKNATLYSLLWKSHAMCNVYAANVKNKKQNNAKPLKLMQAQSFFWFLHFIALLFSL